MNHEEVFDPGQEEFRALMTMLETRDLKKDPLTFPKVQEALEVIRRELERTGGELTAEIEEATDRLFDNRVEKAMRLMMFCRSKEAQAKLLKEEAKKFNALAKSRMAAVEGYKAMVYWDMKNRDERKLETELFTICREKVGKPTVDLKEGCDLESLAEEFHRVVPETLQLDKVAVLAALKNGGLIPLEPGEYEIRDFKVTIQEKLRIR